MSMESIEKICDGLECNISDVCAFSRKEQENGVMKMFSTIELFAGAGGLALGIEKQVLTL